MNRFLTRKKDRAVDDAAGAKKGRKWKKNQPEPEKGIDIQTALPSADDFRTSLIMPGLSTRFSMLREQDDPASKLGKASDDSVLHPKRQSRLHEFGFKPSGLSDIAEVSSINDSIRPPFLSERQNSFDSHMTEDGAGSMMSRSRPGEGNVLFGGRQKVYKISNNAASSKSLGRALYDDDVSMSSFQRLRQEEKQKNRELELGDKTDDVQQSEPSSPTKDLAYSPSLSGYSNRRETSSSTNSGPLRSSTAATSIASQGANSVPASSPALANYPSATSPTTELSRSTTKSRRLYDQGLDQQMNEQQSSNMNRLNSIQRSRAPTGRSTPPLLWSGSRSATNLNDRFNRSGTFRTESPTPSSNLANNNSKEALSSGSSPVVSRPQSPPLSPLLSDSEEAQTLSSALQPHDRGKATALGAFNKPASQFSEQQYAERLKQLQRDRENRTKPSLRERAEQEQRRRAATAERKRSDSAEKQAPSAFSVFQSAANQMRHAANSPSVAPTQKVSEERKRSVQSPDSAQGTTFFASPGESSDEEEDAPQKGSDKPASLDRRVENVPSVPTVQPPTNRTPPPILEHPALRSRSNTQPDSLGTPNNDAKSMKEATPLAAEKQALNPDVDSPTLGPNNGGLSGLVRQHLRNVSNVSSNYDETTSPPPSAGGLPATLRSQENGVVRRQPASVAGTTHSSYTQNSNPWDLEDIDGPYYGGEGESISSVSPIDTHKPKPLANQTNGVASRSQSRDRSASQDTTIPHWEQELRKGAHQRGGSTETQHEREAFQREVEQRQRAIQESLRKASADNSRSASPAPPGHLKTALGMLRSKSSRDSFATNDTARSQEAPTKAMRMLGIGAGSANGSNTSLHGTNDRFHGSEGPRIQGISSKAARVLGQSDQDAQREMKELEHRLQRAATEDARSTKGRSPPSSSGGSGRDRSSSGVSSGRSRSRSGRFRDDLDRAITEGVGSSATAFPPTNAPAMPAYVANPTPPPSDRSVENYQTRLRSRSNSRTNGAGYFEQKSLLPAPINTGLQPMNGASPRLSPGPSPKPAFSPGLPASPRPSPGATSPGVNTFRPQASPITPYSVASTPPISGTTTPVASSFNHNNSAPALTKSGTRKKSIIKSEISEPVFISATSVMDTVDLPPGASLKNGMEPPPPPVPPINPMRRRFGFGRSEHHDTAIQPPKPFAEPARTNSADNINSNLAAQARTRLRKTSSEGHSLHSKAQGQVRTNPGIPPSFAGRNNSPPRPIEPMAEGAMF